MPTYQYRCTECGRDLEVVQKFSDPALTECPACAGALRKVFNAVGVVFKGSGFYRTDSRAQKGAGGADTSAGETKGTDGSTGEKGSDEGSGDKKGTGEKGSGEKVPAKTSGDTGEKGSAAPIKPAKQRAAAASNAS